MTYDDFVGEVQHRARLPSSGNAVKAIRSTLEMLGRRLNGEGTKDLAARLPDEIARFLLEGDFPMDFFSLSEFLVRVAQAEGVELPESVYHTRAVFSVLQDAVSKGEIDHVKNQLPEDWSAIFDEPGREGQGELEGY